MNLMKYLSAHPISSTNSKQNEHLEIHTQTHSQTAEIKKRENFGSSNIKMTQTKGNINKIKI